MRKAHSIGTKGSLKWIQILINRCPSLLDKHIFSQFKLNSQNIIWVSPLEQDDYAEYRDDAFLARLELQKYNEKLSGFWPKRGPQWDALGKDDRGDSVFLIEAKANIQEIFSSTKAKSADSISKISKSLLETQNFLQCENPLNWEEGFYQYANRMAHLYFLRHLCGIKGYLIFIYFTNDPTHIAATQEEWAGAIKLQKQLMGLRKHRLQKYVADVFIDVNDIRN